MAEVTFVTVERTNTFWCMSNFELAIRFFDGLNTRSEFTFDTAYENFKNQRERINNWEQVRVQKMKERQQQTGNLGL